MKKLSLLLVGPTIMIYIGLIIFKSVLITFALFYGWLFFIPLFSSIRNKQHKFNLKYQFSRQSIVVGLISGVISLLAIFGAVTVLKDTVFDLTALRQLLMDWNFTGDNVIWLVLVLIFINPFLEELYWRNFMYKHLENKVSIAKTVVITSFFYSLYHLVSLIFIFIFPFNFIAVIPVFIAGLLWGYFRYKLNSITAPILSHILADLGIMLVYLNYIL
ncbi:CPBP family intramembrane glutamic endopeptidase [Sporosarcina beigongshangi]|uniref:CPBP family intramembrane glutamic endopeptidase n=1 Tax=Sporosarcina beigongshangi TaxID=2782538 RepID=UPI001BA9D881|nr:type II CAAX endopeptidase family protein [Sporosarcina beigongshangi]